MIQSIKLSNLRNNELLQFMKDIVNRCRRFNLDSLNLNPSVTRMEETVNSLENSYNNEQGSDITDQLTQLDASRDKSITGIKLYCEANTYQPNEEVANAASLLFDSIVRHGHSIAKLNYQAETTVIDSILADWKTETDLVNALNTLQLNDWVKTLEEENNNFSSTYQDRVDDKLANTVDSFSDLRAIAVNSYKALCDNIFAYSVINKSEEYSSLSEAINIIIADYKNILDKRSSGKEE